MGDGHFVPGPGVEVKADEKVKELKVNVIPLIFVPGIAGTYLKVKPEAETFVREKLEIPKPKPLPDPWRPPSLEFGAKRVIDTWNCYSGGQRQVLLHQDRTIVDNEGFLKGGREGLTLEPISKAGKDFRGWSSVHSFSYGSFLQFLEGNANFWERLRVHPDAKRAIHVNLPHQVKEIIKGLSLNREAETKDFAIDLDLAIKAIENVLPVYAFGYNWLQSSSKSAQELLLVIKKIVALYDGCEYIKYNSRFCCSCSKVILVTHSMGGMVARAAAKFDKGSILGLVSIACPIIGTPSAYRTVVAGNDLDVPKDAILFSHYGNASAILMGKTTKETTPVMAFSPGCLQLLPSKLYPKEWMKFGYRSTDGTTCTVCRLPKFNPYKEIYSEKYAWYRLIEPIFLDQAGLYNDLKPPAWDAFLAALEEASSFHDLIHLGQWPPTYMCYGHDPKFLTYGSIRWSSTRTLRDEFIGSEKLLGAKMVGMSLETGSRLIMSQNVLNRQEAQPVAFDILGKDSSGDGTVAWQSGRAPKDQGLVGRIWRIRNIYHQDACTLHSVRKFSLWSIFKLINEVQ